MKSHIVIPFFCKHLHMKFMWTINCKIVASKLHVCLIIFNFRYDLRMFGATHYYNSWFFKRSKLISKYFLTNEYEHFDYRPRAWMICVFLSVNFIKVTYLIICQIKHLVKLDKKYDHLGQNDQWLLNNSNI